jgi:hypothetical protein
MAPDALNSLSEPTDWFHRLGEGGYHMICVTTRFRLLSISHTVLIWWLFQRMRRDLKAAPGLVRYAFLVQSPLTVMTLSIWESERALMVVTTVASYLVALRRAHRLCSEIWSAYWCLDGVSKSSHKWTGAVAWPAFGPHAWHANRLAPVTQKEAVQCPFSLQSSC